MSRCRELSVNKIQKLKIFILDTFILILFYLCPVSKGCLNLNLFQILKQVQNKAEIIPKEPGRVMLSREVMIKTVILALIIISFINLTKE